MYVFLFCSKNKFSYFSNYKVKTYHCIENMGKNSRGKLKLILVFAIQTQAVLRFDVF